MQCRAKCFSKNSSSPCTQQVKKYDVCNNHLEQAGLHSHWTDILKQTPKLSFLLNDINEHIQLLNIVKLVTTQKGWKDQVETDFKGNLSVRPESAQHATRAFLDVSDHEASMLLKWTNNQPCSVSALISNICHTLTMEILG